MIHVDEFVVGGKEDGKQGSSYDTKKTKEVIAVELTNKNKVKSKTSYVKAIDDYSAKLLTPIFEEHTSTSAKISTDNWRGYSPLKEKYNIEQKETKMERILKRCTLLFIK